MTYEVQSKWMVPVGHPNRSGNKLLGVRALVFHYTGNYKQGADDIGNARYFAREPEWDNGRWEEKNTDEKFVYASAHYIVDQDSIQMSIPEDEVAWHVGSTNYTPYAKEKLGGKPNYYTIGIEMCVNEGNDWEKTMALSIELGSDIMIRNNLSIDQVIRHYDVTYKSCPLMFVNDEKAWADFKARLAKRVEEKKNPPKPVEEVKGMFKDVPNEHFAKEAVEYFGSHGVVKGDTNGNFNVNNPITRGEVMVILYRLLKFLGLLK